MKNEIHNLMRWYWFEGDISCSKYQSPDFDRRNLISVESHRI